MTTRKPLNASIILHDERGPDGLLRGQICIGGTRWDFHGWRKGGDANHILFECTDAIDPEFEALMDKLVRKVSG